MNEQLVRDIIINDLQFNNGRPIRKLILNVFSLTSASVTARDINQVITNLLIEGEIIRVLHQGPISPEVEAIIFLKGTRILNLEEVIDYQRTLDVGEKSP